MTRLLTLLLLLSPLFMVAQDTDDAVKKAAEEVKEQAEKMEEAVEKLEEAQQEAEQEANDGKSEMTEKPAKVKKDDGSAEIVQEAQVLRYERPSFEVTEEEKDMMMGISPSLTLFIPEADPKKVADKWKDLMNEYKADRKITKESKVKKDDNDVNATKIIIPQVSNELMDVYATALPINGGVEISTSWAISPSDYVNYETTPKKYRVAEQMMQTFAADFTRKMIEDEKKSEEKELKKRRKNHESLVKKNKDLHSQIAKKKQEIEKANAAIKEAERGIVENEAEQTKALEAIAAQETIMDFVQSKLAKF